MDQIAQQIEDLSRNENEEEEGLTCTMRCSTSSSDEETLEDDPISLKHLDNLINGNSIEIQNSHSEILIRDDIVESLLSQIKSEELKNNLCVLNRTNLLDKLNSENIPEISNQDQFVERIFEILPEYLVNDLNERFSHTCKTNVEIFLNWVKGNDSQLKFDKINFGTLSKEELNKLLNKFEDLKLEVKAIKDNECQVSLLFLMIEIFSKACNIGLIDIKIEEMKELIEKVFVHYHLGKGYHNDIKQQNSRIVNEEHIIRKIKGYNQQ